MILKGQGRLPHILGCKYLVTVSNVTLYRDILGLQREKKINTVLKNTHLRLTAVLRTILNSLWKKTQTTVTLGSVLAATLFNYSLYFIKHCTRSPLLLQVDER